MLEPIRANIRRRTGRMLARAHPLPFLTWPLRRQNFLGNGECEKACASMASRAMSNSADAVVASTPVTNLQSLLRPVITGCPLDREIFARHLPGAR